MSFPCTRCGLCCQQIEYVPELSDFHSGNGICRYYSKEKGCAIYELRPLVCRIDEGYKQLFSEQLSISEYYKKNAEVCNQLQEKLDLPLHYRVIVDDGL
jgi:uncharacterized protein